jgi:hypothetical protein
MVAAASAVGGMTVAFVSWVLGVEEPEIVNWVKNTYFGSNWGSADYTDLNSKWYRFRIEDSGYADGETASRVAFGRQISGYLNHKVPFEDRTVEIETFARPYKGVIELRNITKGTFGSDLIVCPIAADSGRPAYPLHVIHLGEPSQTSHGVEITGKTNDQALDMGEEPSWVDDPPGEVWAWTGTMEATGNANYEDFFAAPGEEDPAYYRLRADDYANTAGVELIHVPGGLNNTLREKIETASTAQQATTDAKDVLAIIDELPYPRQRVPRSQLSLPEG